MDKIKKFLLKLSKKERKLLLRILADVLQLKLDDYDVKSLKGMKGVFRLRKGNKRVVFMKKKGRGMVLNIAFRKDVYK